MGCSVTCLGYKAHRWQADLDSGISDCQSWALGPGINECHLLLTWGFSPCFQTHSFLICPPHCFLNALSKMCILKSSELSGYFELLTAAHEAFQDLVSSLISFPARVPTPPTLFRQSVSYGSSHLRPHICCCFFQECPFHLFFPS